MLPVPAELTATSSRPKCAHTSCTTRPTSSSWPTSPGTAMLRSAPNSFAARPILAASRPMSATLAPALASARAAARPIPLPPPVTRATRPASSDIASSSDELGERRQLLHPLVGQEGQLAAELFAVQDDLRRLLEVHRAGRGIAQ